MKMRRNLTLLIIFTISGIGGFSRANADHQTDHCHPTLNDRARFNETVIRLARILTRPDWSEQLVSMMRHWSRRNVDQADCQNVISQTKPPKPSRFLRTDPSQLRGKRAAARFRSDFDNGDNHKVVLRECRLSEKRAYCGKGICHVDRRSTTVYCYCPVPYTGEFCDTLRSNNSMQFVNRQSLAKRLLRSQTPRLTLRRLKSPLISSNGVGSDGNRVQFRSAFYQNGPVTVHNRVNEVCDEETRHRVECENGARCYTVPSLHFAFCACPTGYSGSRCENLDVGSVILEFDRTSAYFGDGSTQHFALGTASTAFREAFIALANAECAGHPRRRCVKLSDMEKEVDHLDEIYIEEDFT